MVIIVIHFYYYFYSRHCAKNYIEAVRNLARCTASQKSFYLKKYTRNHNIDTDRRRIFTNHKYNICSQQQSYIEVDRHFLEKPEKVIVGEPSIVFLAHKA
jgi:hypothetical protein